LTLFTGL